MIDSSEARLYNNRSLFSDYYLRELVRDDPHWRDVLAGASALRQKIADIYKRGTPGIDQVAEAEVERRLIRPVLNALGHVYEVQPDVRSPEGTKTPDYGFFTTVEDRNRAAAAGINEYWKHALAVGDAKAWDRGLDRRLRGPGDPFTNHNPSYQIDFYLRATDLKWGILTNGRLWRLYNRDLSYRLDVYYEVNLPELLEQGDEEFNYFAAFFSQRAFIPDEQGERFLDRAYKGSLDYATGLSKELKDNVYEALRLLTEGFLRFPGNGLAPEELDYIRENAFVVIYRLLFILYAEDRGFLPLENRDYADTYSLRALAKEIAQKIDGRAGLSPAASGYWSRLQDLFRMIDAGDVALGIPPYNGGLFDESRHPELGQWKIGDSYLAQAVDMLARATAAERTGRGFVSYRELSIRELGSIYEGLLEHRPRIAEEPMVVVRDDKRERVIPERHAQGRKVLDNYQPGEVYLTLHRGERKATGSYYTPDYIVKYIVANTLGPLIEERKESGEDLVEAILSLNVLDPAMGSGHFLVEATDFLARALVEALGGDPRELEEDDIRWARREVVERCIYGVDLNPLAVELAKLSLWLHTVSRDRPLNFLDHHLRCGNSLIGAWLKDLGQLPTPAARGAKRKAKAPTAITTLEGHGLQEAIAAAVRTFHAIAEAPTHTVEDVHTKESAYQTARHALSRITDIADAWTSVYFGNDIDPDGYTRLLLEAYRGDGDWPGTGEIPWLDRGRRMGRDERRCFHWEVEFPEIFFDGDGHYVSAPGFDVAVGNPPYVRGRVLPAEEKAFYSEHYESAYLSYDVYVIFVERALRLVRNAGRVSMIVPRSFLTEPYAWGLRRKILAEAKVTTVRDYLDLNVFEDVGVINSVFVLQREAGAEARNSNMVTVEQVARSMTHQVPQAAYLGTPENTFRVELTADAEAVTRKMRTDAVELGRICYVSYSVAAHSEVEKRKKADYLVEARVNDKCQPFVEGKELGRYELEWSGRYLIYDPSVLRRPSLPELFTNPKIIVAGISGRTGITATFDDRAFFVGYPAICLTAFRFLEGVSRRDIHVSPEMIQASLGYDLAFLTSLLNSGLFKFYFDTMIFSTSQTLYSDNLRSLPIRRICFRTPQRQRKSLAHHAVQVYDAYLLSAEPAALLAFVASRLPEEPDGTPDTAKEQSDVVHDLLAHLARHMTDMNAQKQEEAKGFQAWLEGYVGVSVDDLRNKTKVRGYYELKGGWDEFAAILDQNRRIIEQAKGMDISRREPREAIRQEYEASMARLSPLLHKIELTDRLIDLIVYRLYRLTDEEIAIVEGRA